MCVLFICPPDHDRRCYRKQSNGFLLALRAPRLIFATVPVLRYAGGQLYISKAGELLLCPLGLLLQQCSLYAFESSGAVFCTRYWSPRDNHHMSISAANELYRHVPSNARFSWLGCTPRSCLGVVLWTECSHTAGSISIAKLMLAILVWEKYERQF